ncbi:bifunctional ADP-dependent (S)-NAD(P)H-hydrate dehydratase/NAD(P)H-hydrate epimerase [Shewanella xiamenensis]|uniref:Bifunctional NAD(P)H-hydrate repair enzyme n=1 Tax=Shewanella xiamenensis TaxID=332186 RepID=A0ABT6UDX6_9GAMM|nr:NAD(P)H-hydrate dehydratase [Shewanella xiamenensis]MDI5831494.1 NAD(P)H-hydrate dehydratase [Shewanella xiamenensis]TVL14460.1 bifunctional ADP-dependent (S)-NAD(P)H-hydrate dehydratase/NAD(P)H-hydrate epimerase [Shewanella xiamenensis]TVL14536.1 bifunctional ADP-dependent (S)-NAD(P)H-hydrate dehydratase/NAD(P)H-hydrate epimerase [Shewanella xiamenensis]TVL21860.1 bifunctional ADP-dependent (S)-NAD(P)H-hydrate dehydratase/NAD(P)H-hydrate epimerase [Shewanella xiamenensis]TVL28397.1 bifunct
MAQDLSSLPTALYTQEQVRAAELLAVSEGEATLYQLVERAGCAAFNYLTEQIVRQPKLGAMPLLVLAGNGNNGADALVCARLALEAGHKVHVFLLKTKGTPEFEQALSAYLNQGGIVDSPNIDAILQAPILIDGLLGTGVQGAVREQVAALIHAINQSNAWVLSLDLPSGILADTGVVAQVAVMADATLCFGGLKQGLLTSKARHHCGHLAFADLGLTPFFNGESATRVGGEILKSYFAARARDSHKGQSGKVTLIGGDFGMAGAIRLASEACLRAGAGLVTVISRPEHQLTVNVSRPELMFWGCELVDMEVYLRLGWAQVVVLGPGLGKHDWGYNLFKAAGLSDKPCVLDADALNLLSQEPRRQTNWVLTPHPGEAARLLGCSVADIEHDRFAAVRALQQKYGGVVLLKGAGTIIFDGEQMVVAPVGNPGLASGGCGDVLSGIIGALMAQGMDNMQATVVGVVVHGCAADLAAVQGERGMLASDLMPFIRQLVNSDLL